MGKGSQRMPPELGRSLVLLGVDALQMGQWYLISARGFVMWPL